MMRWQTQTERRKRKRMDDLSDSNPSTESEGGGEVCPIVTSAQSLMKENGIGGGMVYGSPIFISALQNCVTSV